jgi:hypothetical protein
MHISGRRQRRVYRRMLKLGYKPSEDSERHAVFTIASITRHFGV